MGAASVDDAAAPSLAPAGAVDPALYCLTQPVSYSNRVQNPYAYDWCIVPNSSYDVVLFGGLAVVLACLLQGRLNTLMVLLAGAVLMGIAWPVNLGALGNSLAIWLGISPWQLFFYVFLPPLLLDAAVRIDWFVFRKSLIQVLTLAFLVVGATCVAMVPIMLNVLGLGRYGWNWLHACLFGAMIASTDAVAIVAIMKTSGGPKRLRVLLEGESLLNDASGLTLFEVFFHILIHRMEHPEDHEALGAIVGDVFLAVVQLGLVGFVMGLVFGVATRLLLRYMRYMGAGHDQEVALTLGMAYLAYWITGVPCKGSGVVAVAVMGLYGASTNCWDMSTHAHETFDGFWETLAFVVNSLVFLYSGAAVVNFFIRGYRDLLGGDTADISTTLWMMPVIFVILCLLRLVLTLAFRPLFIAIKGDMSLRECLFVCVAGLRGSASLIMGTAVVTEHIHGRAQDEEWKTVKAMMVFWTAGFVLLTLLINAPLLPAVLRLTGLSAVPEKQMARRRRAVAALAEHTAEVLGQLQDAEDELLAGVDWAQVAAFVDHGRKYGPFTGQQPPAKQRCGWAAALLGWAWRLCCGCCRRKGGASGTSGGGGGRTSAPGSQGGRSRHGRRRRHRSGAGGAAAGPPGGMPPGRDLPDGEAAAAPVGSGRDAEKGEAGVPGPRLKPQRGRSPLASSDVAAVAAGAAAAAAAADRGAHAAGAAGGGSSGADSDSDGSSTSSSGSGGGEGLLSSMLPAFGHVGEVDVLSQECPFLGFGGAQAPVAAAARGGGGAGAPAGPQDGARGKAGGRRGTALLGRLWKRGGRADAAELPSAEAQPAKGQELARPSRAATAAVAGGGGPGPLAAAAAGPAGGERLPSLRPAPAPALRSLATRSALPSLAYGGSGRFSAGGAPAPPPAGGGHARTGSAGSFNFSLREAGAEQQQGAGGGGRQGSWGLAGGAGAGAAPGSPRAPASAAAGRPAPLQLHMDKALGRTSGVHRGLATRSVNLTGLYGSGGGAGGAAPPVAPPAAAAFGGPLPEGGGGGAGAPGEYDAADAAVDMVSLSRSSSSRRGGAVGGGPGQMQPQRSLVTHSVGMMGAYSYAPGAPHPVYRRQGSLQGPGGPISEAGGGPPGAAAAPPQRPERGLATRSIGLSPAGAAVAPSLHTMSTGFGAYGGGGAGAAGGGGGGSRAGAPPRLPLGEPRSLAARSVPAAQVVAAAAAAAAAARGSSPALAPADAPPGAEAAAGAPGVLGSLRSSFARISVSLAPGRGANGQGSDVGSSSFSLQRGSDAALGKGSGWGASSATSGQAPSGEASAEELADARSWLVSGLKRYFHSKRMEGLLSARGLRILDSACEGLLEDPSRPLALWRNISRDAAGNLLLRVITGLLFLCRQAAVGLRTAGAPGRLLSWPLRVLAGTLQRPLNKVLLASVEVAMEYLMGLTTSPYVEWLQEGEAWSALLGEVQAEAGAAAQFLIDREIEAPERYSAVQSYRVAMAVLRQQRTFVQSLFESGMLDGAEQSQLSHPIEAAERRLELLGPVWRAPGLGEVLRQLPFMRGQPQAVVDFFVKYGHLVMLSRGSRLEAGEDLYVVQSGIIKVSYDPEFGAPQEYFLGAGGVFGLYTALTGEALPGATTAVAQGNALGKGPVLFCFGAKGLRHLSSLAASGDASFQQLELDMHRLTGQFLLERLKPQLDMEVSQALARLAPLHTHNGGGGGAAAAGGAHGPSSPSPPHGRHKRSSRQQRAAWVRQRLNALRAHLKQQVAWSELLLLPGGCSAPQDSHVLLLQGSVQVQVEDERAMADPAAAEVARWMASAGRHQHQGVLPWLWAVLDEDDLRAAPAALPRTPLPVTITAGPEGATLLVCPSAAEEAAQAAAAAAAAAASRSGSNPLLRPSLGRAPSAGAKAGAPGEPPSLARVSGGAGAGPGAPSPAAANPLLRRTLAAAAAADALMEPLPGAGAGSGSATGAAGGTFGPASGAGGALRAGGAAAGAAAPAAPAGSTTRELARTSPVRLGSSQPLAGAEIDNRALVGVDMRRGSLEEPEPGTLPAALAHAGMAPLEAPGAGGGAAAAGRAARGTQARRSRSTRPLHGGAAADRSERRVAGGAHASGDGAQQAPPGGR